MAVLLGGRAAEHLVFGHLSTGAADDLVKATDIARSMATRTAWCPELGHVTYEKPERRCSACRASLGGAASYSEATAREIDAAVRNIVDQRLRARARPARASNRGGPASAARTQLLEKETLDDGS